MCGRFAQGFTRDDLALSVAEAIPSLEEDWEDLEYWEDLEDFSVGLEQDPTSKPSYNVAPSETFMALRAHPPSGQFLKSPRSLEAPQPQASLKSPVPLKVAVFLPRWGIRLGIRLGIQFGKRSGEQSREQSGKRSDTQVPAFHQTQRSSHSPSAAPFVINKRIETVRDKPFFRGLFDHNRIAIPVNGWYEWKKQGTATPSIPYVMTTKEIFYLGGLSHSDSFSTSPPTQDYSRTKPPTSSIQSPPTSNAVVLTTEASPSLKEIHTRMPLLLAGEGLKRWLAPQALSERDHAQILAQQPVLAATLRAIPVSTYVNAPRHKDARCMDAHTPDTELTLF